MSIRKSVFFPPRHSAIFVLFCLRAEVQDAQENVLTETQILNEFELMEFCETEKQYLHMFRIGETYALNRKIRKDLWSLYQKAANHAEYDIAMKGFS